MEWLDLNKCFYYLEVTDKILLLLLNLILYSALTWLALLARNSVKY